MTRAGINVSVLGTRLRAEKTTERSHSHMHIGATLEIKSLEVYMQKGSVRARKRSILVLRSIARSVRHCAPGHVRFAPRPSARSGPGSGGVSHVTCEAVGRGGGTLFYLHTIDETCAVRTASARQVTPGDVHGPALQRVRPSTLQK